MNVYVSSQGERIVCTRCAARAEKIGWRTEARQAAEAEARAQRGPLARLLRRRPKPRRTPLPVEPEPPAEEWEDTEADDAEAAEERAAAPAAPSPDRSPDPAAPGARVERLQPPPSAASPVERALERFNESDPGYTVEGLVKTLGVPWVSVGASAGSASELRITVAWELSWYQWGVDLHDESLPVVELAKGSEIDQLDAPARQWNATAAKDGRIVLASAAAGADAAPAQRRAG